MDLGVCLFLHGKTLPMTAKESFIVPVRLEHKRGVQEPRRLELLDV
jgi:hypothetical protein